MRAFCVASSMRSPFACILSTSSSADLDGFGTKALGLHKALPRARDARQIAHRIERHLGHEMQHPSPLLAASGPGQHGIGAGLIQSKAFLQGITSTPERFPVAKALESCRPSCHAGQAATAPLQPLLPKSLTALGPRRTRRRGGSAGHGASAPVASARLSAARCRGRRPAAGAAGPSRPAELRRPASGPPRHGSSPHG